MTKLVRKKIAVALGAAGVSTLLAACSAQAPRDRITHTEDPARVWNSKYEQVDANKIIKQQSDEAVTRMQQLVDSLEKTTAPVAEEAVPPAFNPLEELKISLVVENGELQYILKALADQTKMNLLIHPNLIGNSYRVSVDFRDVPAMTVFEQLTRIADVAGSIEGNTLIVNPLEERHYQLGFMESNVTNSFSSGGDVLGGSSSGGSASGSTGSNKIKGEFSVSGNNMPSSNPYTELDKMLEVLVGKPSQSTLHSDVSSAANMEEIGMLSRLGSAIRSDLPLYSLNRMTGTLYVRAKPSIMRAVDKMIANYEKILGGQILIDAQIIEVQLDDQYRMGIDWSVLRDRLAASLSTGQRSLSPVTTNSGSFSQGVRSFTITTPTIGGNTTPELALHYAGNSFAAALDLMQHYGDVAILSNPTIRSKHGQPAIISVGTSASYISDTRVVTSGSGGSTVTSQEVQTAQVFDGLMVGVVPFIDSRGDISLSIHPVQSKVDPASLALVDAGGDTRVTLPVVDLKSMVTQIKARSGDMVVLGGLIDQNDTRGETGVPGVNDIPLLGKLFKHSNNENSLRELVLVMRVVHL